MEMQDKATKACHAILRHFALPTSYGLSTRGHSCRHLQAFLGMTRFALKEGKREQ
jgi:hypothetical protein